MLLDGGGKFKRKGSHLSPRQAEVLQLIAEGQANKQVTAGLGVSFKTVDKHRQHLMAKLNIHDTAGITRYVIAEGIYREPYPVNLHLADTLPGFSPSLQIQPVATATCRGRLDL